MSLRQDEVIRRLPANGFNIGKTMREVGYTEQGSRAGTNYASLRKKIEQAFSKEGVQAKILKYEKKFAKDGDNSNLARMIELQAKASGLTKEQNNIQTVVFNEDITKGLPPRKVDITVDGQAQGDVSGCPATTTNAT